MDYVYNADQLLHHYKRYNIDTDTCELMIFFKQNNNTVTLTFYTDCNIDLYMDNNSNISKLYTILIKTLLIKCDITTQLINLYAHHLIPVDLKFTYELSMPLPEWKYIISLLDDYALSRIMSVVESIAPSNIKNNKSPLINKDSINAYITMSRSRNIMTASGTYYDTQYEHYQRIINELGNNYKMYAHYKEYTLCKYLNVEKNIIKYTLTKKLGNGKYKIYDVQSGLYPICTFLSQFNTSIASYINYPKQFYTEMFDIIIKHNSNITTYVISDTDYMSILLYYFNDVYNYFNYNDRIELIRNASKYYANNNTLCIYEALTFAYFHEIIYRNIKVKLPSL